MKKCSISTYVQNSCAGKKGGIPLPRYISDLAPSSHVKQFQALHVVSGNLKKPMALS